MDESLKQQLKAYLERVVLPVELVASLGDEATSHELDTLLTDVASLGDRVSLCRDGAERRRPSFAINRVGTDVGVSFAGVPLGHEFNSLVLALLQVGGHPPNVSKELAERIRLLDGEYHFETYYSLTCQNCPDVVQALNTMSVLNPRIRHTAIDGAAFRNEVTGREVMAVPSVWLNGAPFDQGRMSLEQIVARLDSGSAEREARTLTGKAPFDVLVVGGGPAGAAAAVYAARKGIRTGVLAERFGGQVLDTLSIENLVSVPYTEGPRLAASLEEHVKRYDVDVMNLQRATALVPAPTPEGMHRVRLQNGAEVSARAVIVATGARWRKLGVPGEDEYRNRGVAYCPHCDGPLFKGKRVAVIGGGNSGVEAAIDLAGIVAHVTLLEFDSRLRADDVLQRKLGSLPNVTVVTSAMTTEIHGDGGKVDGLTYQDREHGSSQRVPLDGVFVQIGLVPNSEWLDGVVARTVRGEIEIDDHGAASVPGIYAAGDVTTVPHKQIVVAMGEGSKAALGAFDYLIRTSAPAEDVAVKDRSEAAGEREKQDEQVARLALV
jgi:NADH-dependent peroxiredoxin subunit F